MRAVETRDAAWRRKDDSHYEENVGGNKKQVKRKQLVYGTFGGRNERDGQGSSIIFARAEIGHRMTNGGSLKAWW